MFHKAHLENTPHCTGEIWETQSSEATLSSSHRDFEVELAVRSSHYKSLPWAVVALTMMPYMVVKTGWTLADK